MVSTILWATVNTARARSEVVVFAATRYRENLGNVYQLGASHLYSVRDDGTGFRQLTTGATDDSLPSVSHDGKRVLFWRERPKSSRKNLLEELCSIGFDGTDLRRTGIYQDPLDGFAQAYERFGPRCIRTTLVDKEDLFHLIAPSGKELGTNDKPLFSPDGRMVLANPETASRPNEIDGQVRLIDLKAGRVISLDKKYEGAMWLGNDRMLASLVGSRMTFVLLDLKGREVGRRRLAQKPAPLDDEEIWNPWSGREAYPLWRNGVFFLKAHHYMSDGGYDYSRRITLDTGKVVAPDVQGIEAVSSDGLRFAATAYGWVGGYKGAGAGKLCKLFVGDAKTLKFKQIGFRLMECSGVCFAR